MTCVLSQRRGLLQPAHANMMLPFGSNDTVPMKCQPVVKTHTCCHVTRMQGDFKLALMAIEFATLNSLEDSTPSVEH